MVTNVVMNRIHGFEGEKVGFSLARWRAAVWDGRFALLVPIIILGGIYTGIFTPTEAAAVAVATTITIGLIQGTLTLADFPKMLVSSAKVNGVILPIIAMSLPLAQTLAALNVPQGFVYTVTSLTDNPYMIKLLMIGILIVAGCVMETTPNIVILSPILLPLAQEIGMNDVQFCIMMITALGVGFITPPLGLNLFVISGITGESVLKIAARAVPYVLGMLVVVLLLAYVPAISTVFLPDIY
jgi:tripartite ATP-independent transporter DctM subunit